MTGKATRGGLTGPGGWSWSRPRRRPRTPYYRGWGRSQYPLTRTAGDSSLGPRVLGGYYPGIAPPSTHPVPIPDSTHSRTAPLGDTTNSCFETPVGEPRGAEYSRVSGSGTGYIQLFKVMRLYTAV